MQLQNSTENQQKLITEQHCVKCNLSYAPSSHVTSYVD